MGMEKWLDKIARNKAARELAAEVAETARKGKEEALKTLETRLEQFTTTDEYRAATELVLDLKKENFELFCNGSRVVNLRFKNGIERYVRSEDGSFGNWSTNESTANLAHYMCQEMNCLNAQDANKKFDSMVSKLFSDLDKLAE